MSTDLSVDVAEAADVAAETADVSEEARTEMRVGPGEGVGMHQALLYIQQSWSGARPADLGPAWAA
ncbi:hypothetical protein [Streptomyces sp. NPDC059009]|uniref:hypothetical protein n=1 Tax=Streptomyces sp. NPDC059009 TaxID=3346694 RepID=UPI00367C815B